jgi:hypothetical protein
MAQIFDHEVFDDDFQLPGMSSPDSFAMQNAFATDLHMLWEDPILNDPLTLQAPDKSPQSTESHKIPQHERLDVQAPGFNQPTTSQTIIDRLEMPGEHFAIGLNSSVDPPSYMPIVALDNSEIQLLAQLSGHLQPTSISRSAQVVSKFPQIDIRFKPIVPAKLLEEKAIDNAQAPRKR